jgi:monoterpene epsilon-lactone hydrolase
MKASIQSKIIFWILKFINLKKKIETRSKKSPSRKKTFLPNRIRRNYITNQQIICGKSVVTFEKKTPSNKSHIIFLHGSAYIFEASPNHWHLAERIVKKSSCRMSLIDYPLAPEHDYKYTLKMLANAYDFLIKQYPDDVFILMGDSAGGGLALAFTQKLLKDKKHSIPDKLVLISPWLDLSMSNPDIKKQESKDFILSKQMLTNSAAVYARGEPLENYLLSPIHGDFFNLPETLILFGSEELFYADCINPTWPIRSKKPEN